MENRIGFGKRLGALVLDSVLICIGAFFLGAPIGAMLGVAVGGIAGASGNTDASPIGSAAFGGMIGAIMGVAIAIALISAVYYLLEGFTGFTLGKLILGIRIANEDGTQAPVPTLLGRYAIKRAGSLLRLLSVFSGIGALASLGGLAGLVIFVGCFLALGAKRQALHDQIMKTAVFPKELVRVA